MAKTLSYNGLLGPDIASFGDAGQFIKGEPKVIDDDQLADQLLSKGFFDDVTPAAKPAPKPVVSNPEV